MLHLFDNKEKLLDMITRFTRQMRLDTGTPGSSRLCFKSTRNGQVIVKNFSVSLVLTEDEPRWGLRGSRNMTESGNGRHELVVTYNDDGEERVIYRDIESFALMY